MRPKERLQMIRDQVDLKLARQKDLDHHWEDQFDVRLLFAFNPHILIIPTESLSIPSGPLCIEALQIYPSVKCTTLAAIWL